MGWVTFRYSSQDVIEFPAMSDASPEPSLIEQLGAAQVRAQVMEAECNQWKGIAAALVLHFGGPPGTFTLKVPYEVTQLLVDDPCELYVETNEEGLCFTLQREKAS